MRVFYSAPVAFVLLALPLGAQSSAVPDEPLRVGHDVTAPNLTYKIEPQYSPEASANHIQGTVVLQIVVDQHGRATDISVLSPLGFGLDEQAEAAVARWEFVPGKKAGVPVKILATVEVKFRLTGIWFDDRPEKERTDFNLALQTLKRTSATPAETDRAVQSVSDLAKKKFPPALYLAGSWMTNGEHLPQDAAAGLDLIQKAAAKNYGPAIYAIALRRMEGRDLPPDFDKGLKEMRDAAVLGSAPAQVYLGNRYEKGDGVAADPDRARHYFRLCAAQGVAACQYHLGRLLFDAPKRPERDYLQAVALFQLAADRGVAEAAQIVSQETPKLTAEQTAWVGKVKSQMVQK